MSCNPYFYFTQRYCFKLKTQIAISLSLRKVWKKINRVAGLYWAASILICVSHTSSIPFFLFSLLSSSLPIHIQTRSTSSPIAKLWILISGVFVLCLDFRHVNRWAWFHQPSRLKIAPEVLSQYSTWLRRFIMNILWTSTWRVSCQNINTIEQA